MKSLVLALLLALSFVTLAGSAEADCTCDAKCVLTCINSGGGMSDISVPPKLDGKQCVPDSAEESLDAICKSKGMKGVAPRSKDREDAPALWCDTPTCR
jgi:hypothetical protein